VDRGTTHVMRHSPRSAPSPRGRARLLTRAGLVAAALAIAGCAHLETVTGPVTDAAEARRELDAGIALYDKGDYVNTIRSLLTAKEIWRAPIDTRVTAQKYLAFSHCLLKRPEPCQQSFRDLLKLKPDFELAAAEAGHPMWTAAFKQAKREATEGGRAQLAQTRR
jgi:hypothetical protein